MMHSNPPTTIKIIISKEIEPRHGRFGASLPDGTVLVGSSRQPFLDAARVLIASDYDPDSWLEGWRPGATAFALRGKLGIATGLTVDETRTVFARWKPFSRSAVSPSIRHSDGAATIPATSDRRTSEGAPHDEAHGAKKIKCEIGKSDRTVFETKTEVPVLENVSRSAGRGGIRFRDEATPATIPRSRRSTAPIPTVVGAVANGSRKIPKNKCGPRSSVLETELPPENGSPLNERRIKILRLRFHRRAPPGEYGSPCSSSPWKIANWQTTPQQITFAVLSTGGSSCAISVAYEGPSDIYPSPVSSSPTAFTLLAGSSNQFVTVTSMLPIAGYRFSLNAPSSAGANVTLVARQAGVG
ncbi:hypothetical protein [Bradyrhizobium erythrophlei]|nr:hypothetical protein [Bradyrhizobium erythrophlei]